MIFQLAYIIACSIILPTLDLCMNIPNKLKICTHQSIQISSLLSLCFHPHAVTPTCGPNGIADGVVDIVTDLNAEVKAICKDDQEVDFTTTDDVNFVLPFSYSSGGSSEPCVFAVCTYNQIHDPCYHFMSLLTLEKCANYCFCSSRNEMV